MLQNLPEIIFTGHPWQKGLCPAWPDGTLKTATEKGTVYPNYSKSS